MNALHLEYIQRSIVPQLTTNLTDLIFGRLRTVFGRLPASVRLALLGLEEGSPDRQSLRVFCRLWESTFASVLAFCTSAYIRIYHSSEDLIHPRHQDLDYPFKSLGNSTVSFGKA